MREVRWTLLASLAICGLLVMAGCGGSREAGTPDNDNGEMDPQVPADLTIMTNVADPLIVRADLEDGSVIECFGIRDERGVPMAVDRVTVKSEQEDEFTTMVFSDDGRPLEMWAPEGEHFEFSWLSQTEAVVTVTTADGAVQINTDIDLSEVVAVPDDGCGDCVSAGIVSAAASKRPNTLPRGGQDVSLTVTSDVSAHSPASRDTVRVQQLTSSSTCRVHVQRCGVPDPVPITVWVDVTPTSLGAQTSRFTATWVSTGTYEATIPTDLAGEFNPAEFLVDVVNVLEMPCDAMQPGIKEYVCIRIMAAVAATGVGAPVAGKIGLACYAVMGAYELYCKTFGQSPPGGGPSLMQQLLMASPLNRTFGGQVQLQAWFPTIGPPGHTQPRSGVVTAPGAGPFPELLIDAGGEASIRRLTLHPANPAEDQAYVATADIYCLPAGSEVQMSIVGTDEYRDSVTYTVTEPRLFSEFELWVPGAEHGVRDVVTTRVVLPDGSVLTRDASLVFGS